MLAGLAIATAGKVIGKVIDIIDKNVEDKDLKEKLKYQINSLLLQKDIIETSGRANIVLAEAQGNWLQRNWRPLLMFIFIIILANNYILFPYLSMFFPDKVRILEFPEQFWYLLIVGVGGYIGGRTYEKTRILNKLLNDPIIFNRVQELKMENKEKFENIAK